MTSSGLKIGKIIHRTREGANLLLQFYHMKDANEETQRARFERVPKAELLFLCPLPRNQNVTHWHVHQPGSSPWALVSRVITWPWPIESLITWGNSISSSTPWKLRDQLISFGWIIPQPSKSIVGLSGIASSIFVFIFINQYLTYVIYIPQNHLKL